MDQNLPANAGTQVPSLVGEESTGHRTTKVPVPQLQEPMCLESVFGKEKLPQ